MGEVIFNLYLKVGHSVVCQMEGVSHVFSSHIFKCFGATPPPPPPRQIRFYQSVRLQFPSPRLSLSLDRQNGKGGGGGGVDPEGVNWELGTGNYLSFPLGNFDLGPLGLGITNKIRPAMRACSYCVLV